MSEKVDEEKVRIGKQILSEDDLSKTVTIKGESFTFKFPNPKQQMMIERDVALKLGGVPLDSVPQIAYNMLRMCTTLDYVLVKKPEWWETAAECYDEDMLNELWERYLKEKDSFRGSIREGRFTKDSP